MRPKIYSLEFHCTAKGDFLFCSADSALLKRLGFTQETLSLDRLGINCESLSLLKNFVSETQSTFPSSLHPEAEIPVKTLPLQNKSGEKIQFSAFCSSLVPIPEDLDEGISEQDLFALTLFLVDTEPFAQVETELRKMKRSIVNWLKMQTQLFCVGINMVSLPTLMNLRSDFLVIQKMKLLVSTSWIPSYPGWNQLDVIY